MTENHAKNERIKNEIQEVHGFQNPTGLDILKLKLWKEQDGVCLYSLLQMDRTRLFEPGYADIDHIVPYSISFNDTYANKVLVRADENRKKGNKLPLQYLTGEKRDKFKVWINNAHLSDAKKKRLLKEEITTEDRNQFKERALQDTKTMAVFMYNYLTEYLLFSPSNRKRHVTPVNGSITAMLRKRWGLNKVREDGDTHHAIDAAVVACTTQAMINSISKHYDYREQFNADISQDPRGSEFNKFPQPYNHFNEELRARLSYTQEKLDADMRRIQLLGIFYPENELKNLKPVFVSRMPSRKTKGAAHKETIKGLTNSGEQMKKVPLSSLKLNKNNEIDGYYNPNDDKLLYAALKEQLLKYGGKGEKAFEDDFHKPKKDGTIGPLVRSVKITEKSTLNVALRDENNRVKGSADHDSMIRVDVFYIEKEGYYLVPIYVADTIKPTLPNKAIIAGKSYSDWREMDDKDFIFSLYPNDLIFVEHKKGLELSKVHRESTLPEKQICKGTYLYYKSTNISSGAISIINHDNSYAIGSLGVKTLLRLEKYQVDILGNIFKVSHEIRQYFPQRG